MQLQRLHEGISGRCRVREVTRLSWVFQSPPNLHLPHGMCGRQDNGLPDVLILSLKPENV